MTASLSFWWQKIKQHPYATSFVILLVFVLFLFIFLAYRFGWDWTGFNTGTNQITITNTTKGNYTVTISQPSKSLWDWLQLLGVLAIPAVVALGAAWYTAQQGKVSDRENTDNQRETALQAYIDKMSELLLNKGLLDSKNSEIRTIARVQTLTVLRRLDAERKGMVLQFLQQAGLIDKDQPIIELSKANLQGAYLGNFPLKDLKYGSIKNLNYAILARSAASAASVLSTVMSAASIPGLVVPVLSGKVLADIFKPGLTRNETEILSTEILSNVFNTNLYRVNLSQTDLSGAILTQVNLSQTNLSQTLLRGAYLIYANLHAANLSGAILRDADLSNADLSGAILSQADLTGANLSGAKITDEQLKEARSLKGTTMPDGSKHP